MRQLYIMRVIRHDGQLIGTGWTGKMLDADLLSDAKRLTKRLRTLKVLTGRGRIDLTTSVDGEACLTRNGAIELVFRTN